LLRDRTTKKGEAFCPGERGDWFRDQLGGKSPWQGKKAVRDRKKKKGRELLHGIGRRCVKGKVPFRRKKKKKRRFSYRTLVRSLPDKGKKG